MTFPMTSAMTTATTTTAPPVCSSPTVSIVIVSRERQAELRRVLEALRLQRYRNFETVVVACRPTLAEFDFPPDIAASIRYAHCPEPNISQARNMGLALSAGEIVALTDDDAVPEADWLEELIAPFDDPRVGAVGGYVRNHTGVGFQWKLEVFDENADPTKLEDRPDAERGDPIVFAPEPGRYPQTFGVNSAFRRQALVDVGGFDENFRYFLDETDVNLRLAHAGWSTAIAPRAEVHHFFAASPHRGAARAPKDLFEVGASKAYFIRKHGREQDREALLEAYVAKRGEGLRRYVHDGRLTEADWGKLLQSMRCGFQDGAQRQPRQPGVAIAAPMHSFSPFAPTLPPDRLRVAVAAPPFFGSGAVRMAERLAAAGCETTLFDIAFSTTPLRISFQNGFWKHAGGAFSRHARASLNMTSARFSAHEWRRVGQRRLFDAVLCAPGAARLFDARPLDSVGLIHGLCVAWNPDQPVERAQAVAKICHMTAA